MIKKIFLSFLFLSSILKISVSKAQITDTIFPLHEIKVTSSKSYAVPLGPITVVRMIRNFETRNESFDSLSMSVSKNMNAAELLSNLSSAYIKDYGNNSLASVTIRGLSGSQVNVNWNGLTINNPFNGQLDLRILPLALFDEINLDYGNCKGTFGNIGASINIYDNKVPRKNSISFINEYSSLNDINSMLNITINKNELLKIGKYKVWNVSLKGFYSKFNNQFEYKNISKLNNPLEKQTHADSEQLGYFFQASRNLNENNVLILNSIITNSQRQLPPSMLQSINVAQQTDRMMRQSLTWRNTREHSTQDIKIAIFNDYLNYDDSISNINSSYSATSFIANYSNLYYKYRKHYITLNANYNFITTRPSENIVAINQSRYNISLTDRIYVGATKLTINPRIFIEGIDEKIYFPSTGISFSKSLFSKIIINLNIANQYRLPTLNDLYWNPGGNRNLKAEQNFKKEITLTRYTVERFNPFISLYHQDVKNWIQWIPDTNFWRPINTRRVEVRGIETGFDLNNFEKNKPFKYSIKISYAYNYSFTKSSVDTISMSLNKQLIYTPQHKINSFFHLGFRGFSFNTDASYTSERLVDYQSSIFSTLPSYLLVNTMLNKKIRINSATLDVYVKVKNIFNQSYQTIAWQAMPSRYISLGFIFNFNQ